MKLNTAEKVAMVIAGFEIAGGLALIVWSYGQMKFYEGRISKTKELRPVMTVMADMLKKEIDKNKTEA